MTTKMPRGEDGSSRVSKERRLAEEITEEKKSTLGELHRPS